MVDPVQNSYPGALPHFLNLAQNLQKARPFHVPSKASRALPSPLPIVTMRQFRFAQQRRLIISISALTRRLRLVIHLNISSRQPPFSLNPKTHQLPSYGNRKIV